MKINSYVADPNEYVCVYICVYIYIYIYIYTRIWNGKKKTVADF